MERRRSRGRPPHPDVLTPAEWRVVDAVRHGMTTLANRAALRTWPGVPCDSAWKAASTGGAAMAHDLRLGAIGQISRHVGDLDRAITFYRDVLGLPHLYTFGDLAFFDCAGTRLFLSAAEEGGRVRGESVIYFQVDDIHAACDQLRSRGVEISNAPHLIHRHESGEEEWMAFFADPDDHLLALMARIPGQGR